MVIQLENSCNIVNYNLLLLYDHVLLLHHATFLQLFLSYLLVK